MPPSSDTTTGTRRKRLQLSCNECRKKKLSCDRVFPCRRCVRTGRANQCSFETETGPTKHSNDEIRDLRAEVARLKDLLSSSHLQQHDNFQLVSDCESVQNRQARLGNLPQNETVCNTVDVEERNIVVQESLKDPAIKLSDPRERTSNQCYSPHTLMQFFTEVRRVGISWPCWLINNW